MIRELSEPFSDSGAEPRRFFPGPWPGVREWHLRLAYDLVNCLVFFAAFTLQLYVGGSLLGDHQARLAAGDDTTSDGGDVIAVFILTGFQLVVVAVSAASIVLNDGGNKAFNHDYPRGNRREFWLMIFPAALVAPLYPLALFAARLRLGDRYDTGDDDMREFRYDGGPGVTRYFESAAAAEVLGTVPKQCRDTPAWCWHQKCLLYTSPLFVMSLIMVAVLGFQSRVKPTPTTPLFEWLLLLSAVGLLMPVHYNTLTSDDAVHRCFQCLGWHDGASFFYVVFVLAGAFQFGDGSAAAAADTAADRWLVLWFAVATGAWLLLAIAAVATRRAVADLHDADVKCYLLPIVIVLALPYHVVGKGHFVYRMLADSSGRVSPLWFGPLWRFANHGAAGIRRARGAPAAEAERCARMRHVGVSCLRDTFSHLRYVGHGDLSEDTAARARLQPAAGVDERDGRKHGAVGPTPRAWRLHVYAELFDACAASGRYDCDALIDAGHRACPHAGHHRIKQSELMWHYVVIHAPPMALWALFPAVAAAQATAVMSVVRGVMLAVLAVSLVGALLLSPHVHRYRAFCLAVAPLRCLRDEGDEERALRVARYVTEYFSVSPLVLLQHAIDPAVLPPVVLRDHVAPLIPDDGFLTTAALELSPGECLDLLALPQ
jgi:hypothetical protein